MWQLLDKLRLFTNASNDHCLFDDMPEEIITHIISYLKYTETRGINMKFRRLSDDNELRTGCDKIIWSEYRHVEKFLETKPKVFCCSGFDRFGILYTLTPPLNYYFMKMLREMCENNEDVKWSHHFYRHYMSKHPLSKYEKYVESRVKVSANEFS